MFRSNSDVSLKTASDIETESRIPAATTLGAESIAAKKSKCFRLNFPVSIATPNGSEHAVASREELKAFFNAYRAEGGEKDELSFVYPIEVTLQDGTVQLVSSEEEIQAIKENCPSKGRTSCFTVAFPVTITATDGEIQTLDSKRDWRRLQKSIKRAIENGEATPTINFPIEVITEEGSLNITSQSELDVLKENCSRN